MYGTSTATFTGCTFNNLGKAAKLYNEGYCSLDVTFEDCTFNVTTPGTKGKAAIEIDSHYTPITVTIEGDKFSVDDDYKTGLLSGNKFWNNEPNDGAKAGYEHISSMNSATVNFTVKLDANGGSLPSGSESKVVSYCANVVSKNSTDPVIPSDDTEKQKLFKIKGSAYGDLPTPTKAGASFDGWYTEKTGGTKVTAATEIKPEDATPHTLYAHWADPTEPVAKIGEATFGSLADAVAAAVNNDKIELLKDVTNGAGFKIGETSDTATPRTITIDLGGFTYTIDGAKAIGADAGHMTQGIRIGNKETVTIQNGKLAIDSNNPSIPQGQQRVVWLINNYGNLTLGEDVVIDGSYVNKYENETAENVNAVVFSNTGSVNVYKNASITAPTRVPALYVGWFKDYPGDKTQPSICPSGTVAIIETTGTIDGAVAFKPYNSTYGEDYSNGPKLTVMAGNLKGGLDVDTDPHFLAYAKSATKTEMQAEADNGILIHGGIISTDPKGYLRDDCVWEKATGAVGEKRVPADKKISYGTPMPVTEDGVEATLGSIKEIPDEVKKVSAAGAVTFPPSVSGTIKAKILSVDITVYKTEGEVDTPIHDKLTHSITVTFKVKLPETVNKDNLQAYHGEVPDDEPIKWTLIGKPTVSNNMDLDGYYTISITTDKFSPIAIMEVTPSSSKSSSSQGSSTWLTEPVKPTAQPTPTPTPTPGAVETPSVQPVDNPSGSSAKTPAPFLGILAGLGAAAVVFGLRRK